jgi:hypothetical protein
LVCFGVGSGNQHEYLANHSWHHSHCLGHFGYDCWISEQASAVSNFGGSILKWLFEDYGDKAVNFFLGRHLFIHGTRNNSSRTRVDLTARAKLRMPRFSNIFPDILGYG